MTYLVETEVMCPYCGECFVITVDTSQGDHTMVEDCTVCCRPMSIEIECTPGDVLQANVSR
jgi:hypothetical protein